MDGAFTSSAAKDRTRTPDVRHGISMKFPDVWPIGIGAPCIGCTEKHLAFRVPLFEEVPIHGATPPDTYPAVHTTTGAISSLGVGVVSMVGGALGGAAWVAARRFRSEEETAAIVKANLPSSQKDNPNAEGR